MEFFKQKRFSGRLTESGLGVSKQGKLQVPYTKFSETGPMAERLTEEYNLYGQYKPNLGDYVCVKPYKGYIDKNNLFYVEQITPNIKLRNIRGFSFNYTPAALKESFKLTEEQYNEALRLLNQGTYYIEQTFLS